MAQYTLTIKQLLENNVELFDFDYPIFDEEYRKVLEEKIINHYYFREIGQETVGRFKFFLREKMNLIMPHYNKYYKAQNLEQRILDNYDVTEIYERTLSSSNLVSSNSTNKDKNINLFSDTPMGKIDIDKNDYVSNMSKLEVSGENENLTNTTGDNKEQWKRTMHGNIGVQTDGEAVMVYINSLINVDLLVLNELNELFMGIY